MEKFLNENGLQYLLEKIKQMCSGELPAGTVTRRTLEMSDENEDHDFCVQVDEYQEWDEKAQADVDIIDLQIIFTEEPSTFDEFEFKLATMPGNFDGSDLEGCEELLYVIINFSKRLNHAIFRLYDEKNIVAESLNFGNTMELNLLVMFGLNSSLNLPAEWDSNVIHFKMPTAFTEITTLFLTLLGQYVLSQSEPDWLIQTSVAETEE